MSVLDRTHEVLNQSPPLVDYNVFETDVPLREALEREGGDWGIDRVRDVGALAEALVGPLQRREAGADALVAGLQTFVLRSVGAHAHAHT